MQKRVAHDKRERANSVDDDVASVVSQASDNDKEVIIVVNVMMIVSMVTIIINMKEVFEKLEQLEFKKSDVIGEALCALIGISIIVIVNMYFLGVKSTAHPPIIGALGHSTDFICGPRLTQVDPGGPKWTKVDPSGPRWTQVVPCRSTNDLSLASGQGGRQIKLSP